MMMTFDADNACDMTLLSASARQDPARALSIACAIACAALRPMPGLAAGDAGADLTRLGLEDQLDIKVQTASKFPEPIIAAPATVTVITAAEIADRSGGVLAWARLRALPAPGVLTVGDSMNAVDFGLMIGIGMEMQRMIFNVNQSATREKSVEISSKLLRLAGAVR